MMSRAARLLALFAGLAILHTWPLAGDLSGLSRLDNDDAGLNVFVVSWVAHIMTRNPLALFEAPMFFPEPHTLAYSEHMFIPSMMGAPVIWAGMSPVTVYNLLVLAGFALSGWSMALVVRRWTGSTIGGVVAGMVYAFNAHLLTRLVHLQALHLEFLPLALLAFDRVLASVPGGSPGLQSRPSVQTLEGVATGAGRVAPWPAASLLVVAFVLQALCSNYTLVFLSVALLAAALVRGDEWLWPVRPHRLRALVLAGAAAVALLLPCLWPYYVVSRDEGLHRSIDEVALYSAGWRDYLVTGGRFHYAWWSHQWFDGRTPLFPGIVASVLAAGVALMPEARRDARVRMMAAIGAVGLLLSFGPALPGYASIHDHVPLFGGLRAAARWGVLALTAIAVLAGFALAHLERRWRGATYWPAVSVTLMALITLEALRAPMIFAGVPQPAGFYDRLRETPEAVLVELPLYGGLSVSENARYLLNSTRHFRPLVNGYSGFETNAARERAERWRRFPEASVLREMAATGVTHIALHTDALDAAQVEAAAAHPSLDLVAEQGTDRLYRFRP